MGVAPHFYFAQDELFLIPVEHIDRTGVSAAFADELERRGVPSASREVFDRAMQLLWPALEALAKRRPDTFVPPRATNVFVLREGAPWPPYFRPFEGMSAVVYACDLDPEVSCPEHAAFQLLVSERLGQTRRAGAALREALPFLLSLDDPAAERLAAAARRTRRPDAAPLAALADLLPALRAGARCEGLHELEPLPAGFARVKGTPLALDRALAPNLQAVMKQWDAVAAELSEAHSARQRVSSGAAHASSVLAALVAEPPEVLIVDRAGETVWDPSTPTDTARLGEALRGVGDRPLDSLLRDLRLVSAVTRRFFESVEGARDLAVPTGSLEEAGGVYVHHDRRLIAYALEQPSFAPLAEQAPPYHRLLLAARTIHEWGHLAVDGGVVPVPAARQRAFTAACSALGDTFSRIVNALPRHAADEAELELRELRDEGTRLADLPFSRLEDYRANLLMKRLLPDEVLQAYVRANVRSLAAEPVKMLRKLARYAYEVQYLWLAELDDPWQYVEKSTYFAEEYIGSGLVERRLVEELFARVRSICECYEVDASRVAAPDAAAHDAIRRAFS
ncbi:MAG: hypothetical protein IPM79_07870 [Polyangiaceae bacterium]|nr:hypothetical protein [Polyangiaceae bacterium]